MTKLTDEVLAGLVHHTPPRFHHCFVIPAGISQGFVGVFLLEPQSLCRFIEKFWQVTKAKNQWFPLHKLCQIGYSLGVGFFPVFHSMTGVLPPGRSPFKKFALQGNYLFVFPVSAVCFKIYQGLQLFNTTLACFWSGQSPDVVGSIHVWLIGLIATNHRIAEELH